MLLRLQGYNGYNGGWPSASLFGWSAADWSRPATNESISSERKRKSLLFCWERKSWTSWLLTCCSKKVCPYCFTVQNAVLHKITRVALFSLISVGGGEFQCLHTFFSFFSFVVYNMRRQSIAWLFFPLLWHTQTLTHKHTHTLTHTHTHTHTLTHARAHIRTQGVAAAHAVPKSLGVAQCAGCSVRSYYHAGGVRLSPCLRGCNQVCVSFYF